MLDLLTSLEDYGDLLHVRVTARAAANYIKVEHKDDGEKLIRVYVTSTAQDGKANQAVIALLSKELRISRTSFIIIKGHCIRDKVIKIHKMKL